MERPKIENFFPDGLCQAHSQYSVAPDLFRYSQSLDNYIDHIKEVEKTKFKKAFDLLEDLHSEQNGPPLYDGKSEIAWQKVMYAVENFLELNRNEIEPETTQVFVEGKREPVIIICGFCSCSQSKGIDYDDQRGKPYCIECQSYIKEE